YDLTVRPENGSLTKLILTDDDVEVEYYNRK
ncbi:MAG: histidine phosphatase family protein, partial [Lactobacillus sp.]|nr:histidine phosphatase family protein [Lactobacillus sp.]